jgi:excinuclease ABC subunit C
LKEEKRELPDLILIDGGKGQLASAVESLKKLHLKIPAISLAKREEEIYFPEKSEPLRLPRDSKALQLLQSIRDEAHRFALAYHHVRRKKKLGLETTIKFF